MRLLAVLALIALTGACGSPTAPGSVNVRLTLAPGQVEPVDEVRASIRFQGVFGDSRCPGDAICIQGGDAIVRIDVIALRGASATYDLHTGEMQPVRHGDLTIELLELSPYPFSSLPPIGADEYRATLRVTR